mgnify:FL=1
MTTFPGFVARQELINFCRARVAEMQKESDVYFDALNKAGDKISFDDAASLNDAITANLGEQRAYRNICDWASENLVADLEEAQRKEFYADGFEDGYDEFELCNDECTGSHYHEKEEMEQVNV